MTYSRLMRRNHPPLLPALLIGLGLSTAAAQQPTSSPAATGDSQEASAPIPSLIVTGDEETLCLLYVDQNGTRLFARGTSDEFKELSSGSHERRQFGGMVAVAELSGDSLHAFTSEGEFYAYRDGTWRRQRDLFNRELPPALVGSDEGLFALTESPGAGAYEQLVEGERPTTSQPYNPGSAECSILRYDNRGWIAVAPAPAGLTASAARRYPPRLLAARDADDNTSLYLLWFPADRAKPRCDRLDVADGTWHPVPPVPEVDNMRDAWLVRANGLPTLVAAYETPDGGVHTRSLRLNRAERDTPAIWKDVAFEFAALPDGVLPTRVHTALGFNQHIAVAFEDPEGLHYLWFGRANASPAETTLDVGAVILGHDRARRGPDIVQTVAYMLLLAVLLGLFIFRRGAMAQSLGLPADCAPALALQRMLGFLIDLVPFLALGGLMMGVSWTSGVREMADMPLSSVEQGGPSIETQTWWWVSTGMYAAYALLFELLSRRTLGKMLTGTRVLSESGKPASFGQILARGLLRLVEVQPPLLWLLGFFVLISRNHQRVGDMFARTIVVRKLRPIEPPTRDED